MTKNKRIYLGRYCPACSSVELKDVLGLVRSHFENNEPMFKEYARKIAKTLDENNLTEQADFVLAQLGEVNTFSPQEESK